MAHLVTHRSGEVMLYWLEHLGTICWLFDIVRMQAKASQLAAAHCHVGQPVWLMAFQYFSLWLQHHNVVCLHAAMVLCDAGQCIQSHG